MTAPDKGYWMSPEELPKLSSTTTDLVASLAKGGIGAVPIVGSLIAEIVGNVIPNQRVDRIVRFVELLHERLQGLEQGVLKTKLLQPAAVDLLEDAFTQAARATSQERLEHIANVVANGLSAGEIQEAQSKRMLWLLGQINDSEIILLRGRLARTYEEVQADEEFRSKHAELLAPDMAYMGSSFEELETAALKTSYRQHLFDLGLLRLHFAKPRRGELPDFDDRTGTIKATRSDVTLLGRMLLRYLNLIPNWYSY